MLKTLLSEQRFILSEAAICERLRRMENITLHPTLFDAPLIYDPEASEVLARIYREYIDIAREHNLPILIAAPTWRLDAEKLPAADVPQTMIQDAVDFIRGISDYEL